MLPIAANECWRVRLVSRHTLSERLPTVGFICLPPRAGVVFYQFTRIRQQSQTGSAFLTDEQTEWAELSKMVFRLKPPDKSPVPENKYRR